VCAEFDCDPTPMFIWFDCDDPAGTRDPRPLHGGKSDRAGSLHDCDITESQSAVANCVQSHSCRFDLSRSDVVESPMGLHDSIRTDCDSTGEASMRGSIRITSDGREEHCETVAVLSGSTWPAGAARCTDRNDDTVSLFEVTNSLTASRHCSRPLVSADRRVVRITAAKRVHIGSTDSAECNVHHDTRVHRHRICHFDQIETVPTGDQSDDHCATPISSTLGNRISLEQRRFSSILEKASRDHVVDVPVDETHPCFLVRAERNGPLRSCGGDLETELNLWQILHVLFEDVGQPTHSLCLAPRLIE
jgi:hypothetical protein